MLLKFAAQPCGPPLRPPPRLPGAPEPSCGLLPSPEMSLPTPNQPSEPAGHSSAASWTWPAQLPLGGVCVFPSPYTHLPTLVTHSFASPLYVIFLSHQLCKPHKGRAMSASVPLYDWLTQCLEHQRHSINSVDWIKHSCPVILLVFSTLLSNEFSPRFMLNTHNAQTKSLTWRRRNRTLAWC